MCREALGQVGLDDRARLWEAGRTSPGYHPSRSVTSELLQFGTIV